MGEILTSGPRISGVKIATLKTIPDDRGMVMHMLRRGAPEFDSMGEIYFSQVRAGKVKAWKRHKVMEQNFAVPVGEILLVIYDDRAGSNTFGHVLEIETGTGKYGLVSIPAMVWYGFAAKRDADALIVNCASLPHDPGESERLPEDAATIPFDWKAWSVR